VGNVYPFDFSVEIMHTTERTSFRAQMKCSRGYPDDLLKMSTSETRDKEITEMNSDFLRQAVETLQSHEVENFLIIAQNPQSENKSGDMIRAAFDGEQGVIVAMLMEVYRSKADNLSFILDAFVSLGHLDKMGQHEELEELLAQLRIK